MLWGGLRPVVPRLFLDSLTVVCLTSAALSPPTGAKNVLLLAGSFLLTLLTAGWTSRWTLSFPMVPLVLLQLLRRVVALNRASPRLLKLLSALSLLLILLAATLSVLFPVFELPPVPGPYNVGVVDFYLSVDFTSSFSEATTSDTCIAEVTILHSDLPVRLLYPTLDQAEPIPWLRPHTATEYIRQNMLMAAPPAINKYAWLLHYWRLISIHRTKQNAAPLAGDERLFVIVMSHGLGGTAEMYSYQSMALASQGSVVLQLNHQDGSAPTVLLSNGTTIDYDSEIINLWRQGKRVEYVRERRSRTDLRTLELIAATEALHKMDQEDAPELVQASGGILSLRNRLAINQTIFFGHSFGAATALTAAKRRPDLVHSIIAHDPAVDWMPDDSRRALFPNDKLLTAGLKVNFTGDSEVRAPLDEMCEEEDNDDNASLHDIDMLVLFSREWYDRKWAGSDVLQELHVNNMVGPSGGISEVGVVDGYHTDFSDVTMLLPLWLSRAVNMTGPKSPIETAMEVQERTSRFMEAIRRRSHV